MSLHHDSKGSAPRASTRERAHVPASDPTTRRLRLAAGFGGIGSFAFWLLQPLLVFLIVGDTGTTPIREVQLAHPYLGAYEALTFAGVGAGVLLLTGSMHLLLRDAGAGGPAVHIAGILGAVGGVAWLGAAALSLAPFTSVGYFVPEFVPRGAEQAAVYSALTLVLTSTLMLYGLAMIGWLVIVAIVGRRARVVGRPTAVLALVAAAAGCLTPAMPFSPPWGMLGPLLFGLVFGVVSLAKAWRP